MASGRGSGGWVGKLKKQNLSFRSTPKPHFAAASAAARNWAVGAGATPPAFLGRGGEDELSYT